MAAIASRVCQARTMRALLRSFADRVDPRVCGITRAHTRSCVPARRAAGRIAHFSTAQQPDELTSTIMGLSTVTPHDVTAFRSMISGPEGVLAAPDADTHTLSTYNRDWMRKYEGRSAVVLRPSTTEEVSRVLAYCHARRLPVVPQGGNTGLVGGGVPFGSEVILNMSRMDKIIHFDTSAGTLWAEAGCILQNLESHVAGHGWTVPLDLGAKGSCQIGGNVSTNAGGLRLLRYGSLHGNVLGLKVVLADGRVLDSMSKLRKDNVGYDLKQLFIGAEGTLGVVTEVALQTAPRPSAVNVAMFGCNSFAASIALVQTARRMLGEILSAVEFLDAATMDISITQLKAAYPFSARPPFYVVIETAGSNEAHDNEKLTAFLDEVMSKQLVLDGSVAQDSRQAAKLWQLREEASVAIGMRGLTFKYDLSFPLPHMYDLVEIMRERLRKWHDSHGVVVVGYGHLGDSNVHLNISTPDRLTEYHHELLHDIEPFVLEWTMAHNGSISAEHGLGQSKSAWLFRAKPGTAAAFMTQLKRLLDPHGILNPGKVLGSPEDHALLRDVDAPSR